MGKKTIKSDKIDIPGLDLDDPLDMNGSSSNFLNSQPYTAEYKELAKKWSTLPLYKNKEQLHNFFNSVVNNQVTLVTAGTGSGKTVLVPKFLLKYFDITNKLALEGVADEKTIANHNSKIVITNPKILTTIYNADYSAKTLDVMLGSQVGYKFRGSPENMARKDTKLLYSTDGLLLSQILRGDTYLSDIQGVIIDEAHERQVPIDLLLYFLKNIVKNRPEFKVIIMSATIDYKIFKDFYERDNITFGLVEVSGESNYPIMSHYMEEGDKINFYNYMDVGLSIILKILEETDKGDILMFVTSQRETEIGCNKLKLLCSGKVRISSQCDSYYCAELYGKTSDVNRELAVSKDLYKEGTGYKRKIIFATNVAESSLTVDGVVYVIDSGLELLGYFDYKKYCNVLDKRFTTRAQIKQRMGRAGRTQEGHCYHLYTEDKFNKLEEYPSPAIKLSNLNDHFLSFVKYQKYLSDAIFLAKNLITPIIPWQLLSSIRYLHFYNLIKIVNLEQGGGSKKKNKLSRSKVKKVLKNINYYRNQDAGSEESTIIYESDSGSESSEEDEYNKIEDDLNSTLTLNYKMVPYKSIHKYEDWAKYQGSLTRFGKIINSLTGYPQELAMLAFYGKLLSLPMLYSMVSIFIAMDYKLDNLIKFPANIQNQEKMSFINEHFPEAITYYYSEHLFVYNLLTNYYEMGNKLELLNIPMFEKANDIKNTFTKTLNRISDEVVDEINKKYKLIPEEINLEEMDLVEKVYLAIFLAYRFNTIRLIDVQNKPTYQTQHYFENTSESINFNFGKQLDKEDADAYSWGVSTSVSNIMRKTYIQGVTLIPNKISNKFIHLF